MRRATAAAVLVLMAPLCASAAAPNYEVRLKKAFMQSIQDRTSIEATMVVRHSHKTANNVGEKSQDGDLHFSGESGDIGLPFVAEVVNAAQEGPAVAFIKSTAKYNEDNPNARKEIHVQGAWRLWFEHPSQLQTQGESNPFHPDTTNPDHSFEVHPIATVGQFDVHNSFVPIRDMKSHPPKDFVAYPPDVAFPYYDGIAVMIKASNSGVSIRSQRVVYNYVQFYMELTQKPKKVVDGYIATAEVLDAGGESQSDHEHRMIFVEGTDGAKTISTAGASDRFHVLGIPRLNLNAVLSLVAEHGTTQFSTELPYEMIIVGIYAK